MNRDYMSNALEVLITKQVELAITCIDKEADDHMHDVDERMLRISGMKCMLIWLELDDTKAMDHARAKWHELLRDKHKREQK